MPRAKSSLKILENLSSKSISYHHEILEATLSSGNDPLLQQFTEKLYTYLPVDYVVHDKLKVLAAIAQDSYDFFKTRSSTRKIEIYSSALDEALEGGANVSHFITIKLLGDDKPFIVDSLKCLFARDGMRTKFLFHPAIKATRDEAGNLISFKDSAGSRSESLVYAKIFGSYGQKAIGRIKKEIEDLLDKVYSTYDSWEAILAKLDHVRDIIQDNSEVHDFLSWLKADHFTFLGYTKFENCKNFTDKIGDAEICDAASMIHLQHPPSEMHGIVLGQVNKISPVHKNSFIDYVGVRIGTDEHIFLGLYSSAIYYQSVKNIPILRQKLEGVLKRSGFIRGGYNAKKLRSIIESLPREALFQMDDEHLHCMCLHILSAMVTKNLKVFVQPDHSGEFINLLVFMPRDRLTPEVHNNINQYLSDQFGTDILSDYITEIEQNFCYLYVTLALGKDSHIGIEMDKIEDDIDIISSEWKEALLKEFITAHGGLGSHPEGYNIFPKDYQQKFDAKMAVIDLSYIEQLSQSQSSVFNLQVIDHENYVLKIYSNEKQTLFNLMPIIENLGFKAIDERMFALRGEIWLYKFNLIAEHVPSDSSQSIKACVEDALLNMHSGRLLSDSLCKLVVLEAWSWKRVMILKALTRYLHQTGFGYGKGYVQLTLIKHHEYSNKLLEMFDAKFNPLSFSEAKANKLHSELERYLAKVSSSAEDKVLRSMLGIINAIVRTNCFSMASVSEIRESPETLESSSKETYLSFKFNSSKVPGLAEPVPYAEIFVYANDFEGIHLRAAKVARGGLRWSDRGEDYRTEVLGLMKAQTTKNTVIVPIGSKGGFVLRFSDEGMERSVYMARAVECYKTFLRGLLDLTDNIVDGKVLRPDNMIIYDQDDPYLVVAADKGTASFSDYANAVSKEYNFWLDDAFASGGSAGYDHKKMAITSRGAWISVTNHFAAIGINVQKDPIRVIGIGDMAGDVFGNGMLRSDSIKLVAAFNHVHIFFDPDPDPKISFAERQRLFNMPGSKWSDYNPKLISSGGGLFERSAKTIKLTQEMKHLLNRPEDEMEPNALIKAILKAKVDLLWNGGIGTYVKASDESNFDIGDKANDSLRCDGKDLGASVVGEGGNLGMSMLGRIEFAKNGGRVNTDFIDNSAGVDCSDHEVNIKIAMGPLLVSGKLSLEHRNRVLAEMTQEVAELVLADNFNQNQALNITENSSAFTVEMFSRLIDSLEEKGGLDRAVEFLPTGAELAKRASSGEKMTRPELAVLMSYSKMFVYDELLKTAVPNEKYFEKNLLGYFPSLMQKEFRDEILTHPLRREIIVTFITNSIVNRLSGPLIDTIHRETGAMLCDIVRAYFIINEIFDLDSLWKEVEKLDGKAPSSLKIEMFTELSKMMRRGISWFVRNLDHPIDIAKTIKDYRDSIQSTAKAIEQALLGDAKTKINAKAAYYISNQVDANLADRIALLDCLISAFDILLVARDTKVDHSLVAKTYFEISESFSIDYLRKCAEKQINESYWNRLSIQAIKDDLYDKQRRLLQKIITDNDPDVDKWRKKHEKYATIFTDFIDDLKLQENIDINMLILANKKFEIFLRKV
jgi:glutamate dehydrogenase